ncbi:hypothetical protein CYLTODRAFT_420747 [Cylindrobasidium torrendii FP15055 ss-10]|uniref:Granulins domain-containing protein n=1 Tax=Cylindrobasidium torrendii FP15055 ss-10 TaxID=1314674 RepID=A0A0D7BGZ2_9AGAR|nr:hypothetical protein CYLTODRAFT_420747 [Cylindrobasidium torrendii FP15055 ss-10]
MFSSLVLLLSVSSVLAAIPSPRIKSGRYARREDGRITALLRQANHMRSDDGALLARQAGGSCQTGYLACDDGSGCCPIGEYCGEWDGLLGCCPIGETCQANPDQECNYQGYSLCDNKEFCCPTGDVCYYDSTNAPACGTPGGSGDFSLTSGLSSATGGHLSGFSSPSIPSFTSKFSLSSSTAIGAASPSTTTPTLHSGGDSSSESSSDLPSSTPDRLPDGAMSVCTNTFVLVGSVFGVLLLQ